MSQDPILSVKNLSVHLQKDKEKVLIVDDISFDLYPGKTLALIGESGCGKSVSALSLMGLLPAPPFMPPTGEVLFEGENLLRQSDREWIKKRGSSISMVFQNPMTCLNPVFTIGQQLIETALFHGAESEIVAYEEALSILKEVHLPDPVQRMEDYPHQLSGGMRQRLMLALALIAKPKILIADEPTTALDLTVQRQVLELIKELQINHKMALLIITHDISIVAEHADDLLVMYSSQAVEKGKSKEIFEKPIHPYTQGLLSLQPTWEEKKERATPIKGQVPSIFEAPSGCRFHPRCQQAMPECQKQQVSITSPEKGRFVRCLLY